MVKYSDSTKGFKEGDSCPNCIIGIFALYNEPDRHLIWYTCNICGFNIHNLKWITMGVSKERWERTFYCYNECTP